MSLRHYYDLQWRFDVMVAGRCVRAMTNPVVVLKLETKQGTGENTLLSSVVFFFVCYSYFLLRV